MGDFSKKALCSGLITAAYNGNPVALQALLAQGADINMCNTMSHQSDADSIKKVSPNSYETYYARPHEGTRQIYLPAGSTLGMSLLHKAVLGAADWHHRKTKDLGPRMKTIALLSSVLGVNNRSGFFNSQTPLHVASTICQPELILLLLSMGADPNIPAANGGRSSPEMVPDWCREGLEAYKFYYLNAAEKTKKK